MSSQVPPPPAGWYPDPELPGEMRWWDGRTWAPSTPRPAPPPKKPLLQRGQFWAFVVIGIVTLALLANMVDEVFLPQDGSDAAAFGVCTEFVSDRLKSPATADFPPMGEADITRVTDTRWTVTAYVDSQNGFGATVRTDFTCELRYQGDESWNLVDLTTSQR